MAIFIWRKICCNIFEDNIKHIICKSGYIAILLLLCFPVSYVFFNQADFVQSNASVIHLGRLLQKLYVSKAYLNLSGLQNATGNLTDTFISFSHFCFCPQSRSKTKMKETNLSEFLKPQKFSIHLLDEVLQPSRRHIVVR